MRIACLRSTGGEENTSAGLVVFSNLTGLSLDLRYAVQREQILDSLLSDEQQLQNLTDLEADASHSVFGLEVIQDVLTAASKLQRLTSLSLAMSGNRVTLRSASELALGVGALQQLDSLHLDLRGCFLDAEVVEGLAVGFASLENLTNLTLKLSMNDLGDQGAWAIGEVISRLRGLRYLFLEAQGSKISNLGAEHLSSSLAQLPHLTSLDLDLGFNQIGELGARDLGNFIAAQHELIDLVVRLKLNDVGGNGAQGLLSACAGLKSLQSLTLDFSYIGAGHWSGCGRLAESLAASDNMTMMSLDLTGIPMQPGDAEALNATSRYAHAKVIGLEMPLPTRRQVEPDRTLLTIVAPLTTPSVPPSISTTTVEEAQTTIPPNYGVEILETISTDSGELSSTWLVETTSSFATPTTSMASETDTTTSSTVAAEAPATTTVLEIVDDDPMTKQMLNETLQTGFLAVVADSDNGTLTATKPLDVGPEAFGNLDELVVCFLLLGLMLMAIYFCASSRMRSARERSFNGGVTVAHSDDNEHDNGSARRFRHPHGNAGARKGEDGRHKPVPAMATEPEQDDEWGDFASAETSGHGDCDSSALTPTSQTTMESMLEAQINAL